MKRLLSFSDTLLGRPDDKAANNPPEPRTEEDESLSEDTPQITTLSNPELQNLGRTLRVRPLVEAQDSENDSDNEETSSSAELYPKTWPKWRVKVHIFVRTNPWFERFIFLCIFVNCVLASLEDASKKNWLQTVIYNADYVFTGIYFIEMVLKIIALGFIRPNGYFRSKFNIMDFIVLVVSVYSLIERHVQIGLFSIETNANVVRIVRLLRPLKAISALTSLKVLVRAITSSFRPLGYVVVLYLLVMLILGVMGVELYKGRLRYRCVTNGLNGTLLVDPHQLCDPSYNVSESSMTLRPYVCPWGSTCGLYGNPLYGEVSFDNIGSAMNLIASVVTLEGWSDLMYMTMDATNVLAALYFVVAVVVGGLFFVNLGLVIIFQSFDENLKSSKAKVHERKKILRKSFYSGKVEKVFIDFGAAQWMPWNHRANNISPWRRKLQSLVESETFSRGVVLIIVLNAITLATEYQGMPKTTEEVLFIFNFIFTCLFSLELLLKMIGYGAISFFTKGWNIFDSVVVVLSLVELIVPKNNITASFNVSTLRCMRLFEVFQESTTFPSIKRWIGVFMESLRSVMILNLLIGTMIFCFALLGVHIFSGKFCGLDLSLAGSADRCAGLPRLNFDNMGWSLLTVFSILAGDDWPTQMQNGMRGAGIQAAVYFSSCYIIGNYTMLNLFVALLLTDKSKLEDVEDLGKKNLPTEDDFEIELLSMAHGEPENKEETNVNVDTPQASLALQNGLLHRVNEWSAALENAVGPNPLWILPEKSSIRTILIQILHSPWVEGFLTVAITVSIVVFAFENPLEAPDVSRKGIANRIDIALVIVFATEVALKIFACGFVLHKDAYLRRDIWNVMDFVITAASLAKVLVKGASPWLRVVSVLRVLRPLRFIRKSQGLKLLAGSLVSAMPHISSVAIVALLVWFMFSTVAMNIFRGKINACTEETWNDHPELTTRAACLNQTSTTGRAYYWQPNNANYDNIFQSMLTMFSVATLEGWIPVMFNGIDAVDYENAPRRDNNPLMSLFFVSYIMVMTFFVLNMFIGVLIDTFVEEKKRTMEASRKLTQEQAEWVQLYKNVARHVETPIYASYSSGSFRDVIQKIVLHPQFEMVCYMVSLGTVVTLLADHADATPLFDWYLKLFDSIFSGLIVLELSLRIIALGFQTFVEDSMNVLDVGIATIGVSITVLEYVGTGAVYVSVLRPMRLMRLVRICLHSRGLRTLMKALILSLPAFLNVVGFIFLLLVVFAFVGVQSLHGLKRSEHYTHLVNFDSFPAAMLLLFRILTGENWQHLMFDAMVSPPFCDEHLRDCGYPIGAPLYFMVFYFIGRYILLNVFVTVIMDAFGAATTEEGLVVQAADMAQFRLIWASFDPGDTRMISADAVASLLRKLGPPLAPSCYMMPYKVAMQLAINLDVPVQNNHVAQQDLLDRLLRHSFGVELPPDEEQDLRRYVNSKFRTVARNRKFTIEQGGKVIKKFTMREVVSATIVQSKWRAHKVQGRLHGELRKLLLLQRALRAMDTTDAPPKGTGYKRLSLSFTLSPEATIHSTPSPIRGASDCEQQSFNL